MNRFIIAAICLASLSGCAHDQTGIEVRTAEVLKPIPVACVKASDVPAEPAKVGGDLTGDAAHDADILAASALELRQWGRELLALITPGCTKP